VSSYLSLVFSGPRTDFRLLARFCRQWPFLAPRVPSNILPLGHVARKEQPRQRSRAYSRLGSSGASTQSFERYRIRCSRELFHDWSTSRAVQCRRHGRRAAVLPRVSTSFPLHSSDQTLTPLLSQRHTKLHCFSPCLSCRAAECSSPLIPRGPSQWRSSPPLVLPQLRAQLFRTQLSTQRSSP
jgi:hypothetical protein